jgi:hypothetical protein
MAIKQSLTSDVQSSLQYATLRGVDGRQGDQGPPGPPGDQGPPGPAGPGGYLSVDTLSEFLNVSPSLHLAYSSDCTLKSRIGPSVTHSRASSGTFTNVNGTIVGKTTGTTSALVPNTVAVGSDVTVTVPSGQVIGWDIGATVTLHTDSDGNDVLDGGEAWITGTIKSVNTTTLVLTVVSKSTSTTSTTSWTLGYSGPRFHYDYANGVSGLLLETASATNLILQSENLATTWITFGAGAGITQNSVPAPSGLTTADTITPSMTAASGVYQHVTVSPSTTYTFSFYARLGTLQASDYKFAIYNNSGSSWLVQDAVPTTLPNTTTWSRVSYTFTTPAGCTLIHAYPFRNSIGVTGTAHIWGAQMEAGHLATSYIPTTTVAVVRSPDVCSLTDSAFYNTYNQEEGTIVADFWTPLPQSAVSNFSRGIYGIHRSVRSTGGHAAYTDGNSNSISAYSYGVDYAPTITRTQTGLTSGRVRVAHGYRKDDAIISINGNLTTSLTYDPPLDCVSLALGTDGFSDVTARSSTVIISDFKIYRRRLSNDLIRIHSSL